MLPRVILHNAVSADGRTTGLRPNRDLLQRLTSSWDEDLTLAGCDTILAELREDSERTTAPAPARRAGRLAVIDSRGRIKEWRRVKTWPNWDKFVSIGAGSTPRQHHDYLRYQEIDDLTAGDSKVDLHQALEALSSRYGIKTVRVESGGTLNAVLLQQGLVDEVSLLMHPVLIGGMSPHTVYRTLDLTATASIEMKLLGCQMLDETYAWLRYKVIK